MGLYDWFKRVTAVKLDYIIGKVRIIDMTKTYFGHNVECMKDPEIVDVVVNGRPDKTSVYRDVWIFYYQRVQVGDMVLRKMQSGKVGAFLVGKKHPSTFQPSGNDLSVVDLYFVGYYGRN